MIGMGRQGMQTEFWWVNLLGNIHLEVKGAGKITLTWILGRCAMKREVDGTGSESFLTAGFGINSVEPSGSATRKPSTSVVKWCNALDFYSRDTCF